MKLRMSVVAGLIAEETRRMRPLETQRLCADLYVIQDGFANVFLVNTGDGFIAIDAGINPQNIAREMKILGIEPSAVKAVLITHSDIDHVYGLGAFPANALNLTLPYRTYANVACFGAVVGSFCLAGCGIDCGPWRPGYRAMPPMPERCRAGTRRGWA